MGFGPLLMTVDRVDFTGALGLPYGGRGGGVGHQLPGSVGLYPPFHTIWGPEVPERHRKQGLGGGGAESRRTGCVINIQLHGRTLW